MSDQFLNEHAVQVYCLRLSSLNDFLFHSTGIIFINVLFLITNPDCLEMVSGLHHSYRQGNYWLVG